MWRKTVQRAIISCHNIVRRRDDRRVVAQFPDTPEGRQEAENEARRRNRDPNASMPPYYPDSLVEGERFYDKHGREHHHKHSG